MHRFGCGKVGKGGSQPSQSELRHKKVGDHCPWSSLGQWKVSLPIAEVWDCRSFKVPSNPNHFRIFWEGTVTCNSLRSFRIPLGAAVS